MISLLILQLTLATPRPLEVPAGTFSPAWPRGTAGQVSAGRSRVVVRYAYGLGIYDVVDGAATFQTIWKSPWPPKGDGQNTCAFVGVSPDGNRIVVPQRNNGHATVFLATRPGAALPSLAGEYGIGSTGGGFALVDQFGVAAYTGISGDARGLYVADLSGLPSVPSAMPSDRIEAPAPFCCGSTAGLGSRRILAYSSGASIVIVDIAARRVLKTLSAIDVGLSPGQVRGTMVADAGGLLLLMEGSSPSEPGSRGVALLRSGDGIAWSREGFWTPPPPANLPTFAWGFATVDGDLAALVWEYDAQDRATLYVLPVSGFGSRVAALPPVTVPGFRVSGMGVIQRETGVDLVLAGAQVDTIATLSWAEGPVPSATPTPGPLATATPIPTRTAVPTRSPTPCGGLTVIPPAKSRSIFR